MCNTVTLLLAGGVLFFGPRWRAHSDCRRHDPSRHNDPHVECHRADREFVSFRGLPRSTELARRRRGEHTRRGPWERSANNKKQTSTPPNKRRAMAVRGPRSHACLSLGWGALCIGCQGHCVWPWLPRGVDSTVGGAARKLNTRHALRRKRKQNQKEGFLETKTHSGTFPCACGAGKKKRRAQAWKAAQPRSRCRRPRGPRSARRGGATCWRRSCRRP